MKNLEKIIYSKNKIYNILSFKSDNSLEEDKEKNIFPLLHKDFFINKNNNKIKDNENTKKDNIIIEKGILISPMCLLSNNKYCFGSRNLKFKFQSNDINKNESSEIYNIKTFENENSRNRIKSLNRISSNLTKISNFTNLLKDNKNSFNCKTVNGYKSRNKCLNIEEINNNNNVLKKNNFFTNETLSSCCKDIFDRKINKLNNKKNSALSTFNEVKQITLSQYLNKKSKSSKNKRKKIEQYQNNIINDYNDKAFPNKSTSCTNKNKKYLNRKNHYIFKCNPYMVINKFIDLPEKLKVINKSNEKLLRKEADKYFGNNFSLIQKEKFPYKFRNPLLNNNILNDTLTERGQKEIINEKIISGIDIINEININKNKEKSVFNPKKAINKIRLLSKFKSLLIKNSNYIKNISLTFYKPFNNNINNKELDDIDYYINKNQKTTELIQFIKTNNLEAVSDLIEKNKESVTGYDIFYFTPLHWAVKKDFYLIIPKLISYNAKVNSQNFLGETPLHISIKKNNYECTVLLLIFMASPFIKNSKGKKPFDYTRDYQMKIIYKKITKLYYKNMFSRNRLFYENIQNEFLSFIIDEFSTQLKKDCLAIVSDIQREKKNRIDLELQIKKKKN